MPFLREIKPADNVCAAIWRITETVEELISLAKLSEADRHVCDSFKNVLRKQQWLGYRALLAYMLSPGEVRLQYDGNGKPGLVSGSHFISVSHAGDLAAAVISKEIRTGIDIEMLRPRVERVKDRFMSDAEFAGFLSPPSVEQLYHYWCAKEALYKIYGSPGVDFRNDIRIHPIDYLCTTKNTGKATLTVGGCSNDYHLYWEREGLYLISVAWETVKR